MSDMEKKTSAKDKLKKLTPCWVISFVLCYMLFICEPLMMYCTNKTDIWFDLGMMAGPMLCIFLMFFVGSAAVLTGLYFLSEKVAGVVLSVVFTAFVVLYIQGNFLAGSLPVLDGSRIKWGTYSNENIITLVICLVIESGLFFAVLKLGLGKTLKYAAWLSAAVFVMLTVSLAVTAINEDIFQKKNNFVSTAKDFNVASSDRNFFIFMADAQNAAEFSQAISEREEFDGVFDDFTFFSDAMSVDPFTRESVPMILSGEICKNEEEYGDYAAKAYNGSPLFRELDSRGYDLCLYDREIVWYGEKDFEIGNDSSSGNTKLKFGEFFEQEMRYVWFRYLPYAFKRKTRIEDLDFGKCTEMFNDRNDAMYKEFTNAELSLVTEPRFCFIHAEGAHVPLNMDENMNRIENGTYLQKTTSVVKLIAAFLERLKENGIYDNSVIIIMADHGYESAKVLPRDHILARYNPILLVKGAGEKHELAYSDKPVSYTDLQQAYTDLLDGKQSSELFADVNFPRTRTIYRYVYTQEYHMVEFRTDGKANEWDKFVETGAVFDLPKK